MHRHSRLNKPSSKGRAATVLAVVVIAVCTLLAVRPVIKSSTFAFRGTSARDKTYAIADDGQIARERAIQLGLSPAGKFPISKYDLVSAMPSDQSHLPVVKGSRAWRKVLLKLQSTS